MPYRRAAAPSEPSRIVRLPPKHSLVLLAGGVFLGAPAAFFLWLTIVEGPTVGIAISAGGLLLSFALLAFASSGVHADPARGGILRWSGPGFPLVKTFHPVSTDDRLELVTKTVTHRGGYRQADATITTHALAFVGNDERLIVTSVSDHDEARRRAELVAKAFAVDLHEDNEGKRRTVSLADPNVPLRTQELAGKPSKRPKQPTKHGVQYRSDGDVGTIELPQPTTSKKPLLVVTACVAAMLLFWFNRGADSELPFYVGLTGFCVLLSVGLKRLLHHRTRARTEAALIVASPEGLQLTLRGMLRVRNLRFDVEELEDLDVVQVGNGDVHALLARSDSQEVLFAAGMDRAALRWTRNAIVYHLTR